MTLYVKSQSVTFIVKQKCLTLDFVCDNMNKDLQVWGNIFISIQILITYAHLLVGFCSICFTFY